MSRCRVTPAARLDLLQIWEYVAHRDGVSAADGVISDIRSALQHLAEFPETGHRRDDLADESLRVWSVHSYLIVYRPNRRPIEIVRVVSGYRDLFPLFVDS